MTEFTDASGNLPEKKPATVPVNAAPNIAPFAVWPHGALDPDPVKAEIQRNWLMVELFLLEEQSWDYVEAARAVEHCRTWPENGDWVSKVYGHDVVMCKAAIWLKDNPATRN